jgi:predicted Zn finger-like uncharacterized protein
MILTCPECATSYFVDDSRISPAGRTVKCSNCGARWTALPGGAEEAASPPAAPAASPAAAPPPEPVDELVVGELEAPLTPAIKPRQVAARPTASRGANGKVLVWAGSAAAAALLIAAAIIFRGPIVRLLPASQAAYAGLGMPVSSLAIEQVRADPAFQGGRPVLAVTGQLRNLRDVAAVAPALRVSLLDRTGKPVAEKVAKPINAAVPAHAVRHFAISIVDPPASVHDLEVAFQPGSASSGKAAAGVRAPVAPVGPQPVDATPLPPGSPDALPGPR